MGETLRYQELSPVEVVEEEEEDMEEEGVATEVDAVEAATEVEDMVEVCNNNNNNNLYLYSLLLKNKLQ